MDGNVVRGRLRWAVAGSLLLAFLGSDRRAVGADDGEPEAYPSELLQLYEQVRPAVVRIAAGGGYGSGFVIADGSLLVTAHHVVAGAETVWVQAADGTEMEATAVAWDRKADAALLRLDEPLAVAPLILSPDEPAVGDPLFAVGHPLVMGGGPTGRHEGLLEWSFTAGMVSVVGEEQIQTTVMLHPGNSGGPVFDADGQVVGIAVERNGDFGLARKVDVVQGLMAELEQPERPRRPVQAQVYLAPRVGLTAFPTAAEDRRLYGGLGGELGVTLDHRLLMGLRVQHSWLTSGAEREAGRLGQHTELSFLMGPSFTLGHARKAPVHFRLQPHGIVGVGVAARGTRVTTLEYTDPACDPTAGPCAYQEDTQTDWNQVPYLLVGAGLRMEMGNLFFDVAGTVNPINPANSVGVGFTFGVRFGRP